MQSTRSGFSSDRVLFYWREMFGYNFKAGGRYEDLEPTYSVNVLGFRFLECEEYHSSYSIREDKRHDKFTDKMSIHIFELPKVPKDIVSGDKAQVWMNLIKADNEEALDMVRTTTQDPIIQKGVDAIYELNADTVLREKIRQRDKAIRDYENDMASARLEGKAEGKVEGLAEGRAEGKAEERSIIAERMRNAGFTEEQIKHILGKDD